MFIAGYNSCQNNGHAAMRPFYCHLWRDTLAITMASYKAKYGKAEFINVIWAQLRQQDNVSSLHNRIEHWLAGMLTRKWKRWKSSQKGEIF